MRLTSAPRVLAPEGTHTAILYQIVDLGTQKVVSQYGTKIQRLLRFTWELCDEMMEDGRPFAIGKRYSASSHPKSVIAKDIKSWTGQTVADGFNPATLLGKACNLTVTHEEKGETSYANVTAITPLKKSDVAPTPKNPLVLFDLDNFDQRVFNDLPEFLRNMIVQSPEYIEITGRPESPSVAAAKTMAAQPIDEEIPF